MNQSVIFPDLQSWQPDLQCVVFPVQVAGVTIECRLSLKKLELMAQCDPIEEQHVLTVFEANRFDVEDLVEALIVKEQYDEQLCCLTL